MKLIPESAKEHVRNVAIPFKDNNECWNWPNSKNKISGYGQLSRMVDGKRKVFTAHRVSYAAFIGDIPKGMCVCHKCDNPNCFNPSHLFIGTHKDNTADMFKKGRNRDYINTAVRGDKHGSKTKPDCVLKGEMVTNSKLNENDVREILMADKNTSHASLARKHGVTLSNIYYIRHRITWKHVLI